MDAPKTYNPPNGDPPQFCCGLAVLDQECPWVGHKKNYKCPPGFYKSSWTCVEATRVIYCAECVLDGVSDKEAKEAESKGEEYGDCWTEPFACSIWYDLPTP